MKSFILLISIFSLSAFSAHNINGSWKGAGSIVDAGGNTKECFEDGFKVSVRRRKLVTKFIRVNDPEMRHCLLGTGTFNFDDHCFEFTNTDEEFSYSSVCEPGVEWSARSANGNVLVITWKDKDINGAPIEGRAVLTKR